MDQQLIDKTPGNITIKIKTLNNTIYHVQVNQKSEVSQLQVKVQENTGVPVCSQRLLFKGCLLQPLKTLQDYNILQGSTIKLVANRIPSEISSPSTYRQSEVIKSNNITQQYMKLRKHKYLQKRTNGFNIKQLESLEVIYQNKKTINQLLGCLRYSIDQNNLEAFSIFDKRSLDIGDWIDIRDVSGLWVEGQIIGKYSHFVEIKYNGYPDKWNQWIPINSDRILPFRTQTVQTLQSPYLSPFPIVKPPLSTKNQTSGIEVVLKQLPSMLKGALSLINEVLNPQQNKTHDSNEYEDCGESFKNNRSHNSPRESMHQQQYYQDKLQNPLIEKKETERDSGSTKGVNKKKLVYDRFPVKYGILNYSKTKSEREHNINSESGLPNQKKLQTVNYSPNLPHKKIFFNSEKVEEDHSEYLPDDDEDIGIKHSIQEESQGIFKMQEEEESQTLPNYNTKAISCQSNSSKNASIKPIPEENNEHLSDQAYLNETNLIITQPNLADNISNKCNEENISNKGEQDNDDISAKSFKSKRSQGLVDTASMKSLIIGPNHNHHGSSHEKANRKNIFFVDQSKAHSVRETKKDQYVKSTYYYNQENILQEEDSQLNEEINEEFQAQKKKELHKRLKATQLAPILDRMGRMMVDIAPHIAMLGFTEHIITNQSNENLSTYTNEGSLQSRMRNFTQQNHGPISQNDVQSLKQMKDEYWNFQIPVMLTPWQIIKLNQLLQQQSRNPQDSMN